MDFHLLQTTYFKYFYSLLICLIKSTSNLSKKWGHKSHVKNTTLTKRSSGTSYLGCIYRDITKELKIKTIPLQLEDKKSQKCEFVRWNTVLLCILPHIIISMSTLVFQTFSWNTTSTHLRKGIILQSIFSYYVTQKLLQRWVISCFQVACSTNYHYIKHLFFTREHEWFNRGVTQTVSFFEEILQTTIFFFLAEITKYVGKSS